MIMSKEKPYKRKTGSQSVEGFEFQTKNLDYSRSGKALKTEECLNSTLISFLKKKH